MGDKLHCSICLDPFTDPRILPCIHTFCRDCLKEYVTKMSRSEQKIDCPVCRERHTLPSTGVDGLKKNFYLDEPTKEVAEPSPQMCVEHPKEDLRFFCCDCKKQICRDCKIVSHEGHATDMVDNVVAEMKVTLEKFLTEANRSIQENGASLIAAIEPELQEHEISITVLTTHAEKMKLAMDELLPETLAMTQPLDDRGKVIVQDIRAQMEEMNYHILKYKEMLSEAIKTKKHKPVFELFEKLIDHEVIKELTSPPLIPELETIEAVGERKLKSTFVRFTESIMHSIDEFKTKDFKERRSQRENKQRSDLSKREEESDIARGVEEKIHIYPGESSTDAIDSSANQMSEEGSHDPLTCPIVPGQETSILIEKGRTGLGLSIVGGADTLLGAIIIHEVYEDGAAFRDRRLMAGDQVLEVNGENLRESTHDYAIQVLRQTPSTVRMLVFRDDSHVKEEDIYDIFTVELIKKPGKGLGLSIVGKRNDVGVYISDIVKGGASEADGRLMQGDQILAVNGEDMRNATQEYAASVLKTLMGKVTLTVGRLKAGSRTSSRRNSNSPGHPLRKTESTASNKSRGGRHSKKNSEDMSHIRTIELQHDASGSLGLSIAGGVGSNLGDTPVVMANMTTNGPAERSRRLKVGDKILSINGVSTEGLQHNQVIQMLKSAEDSVTLQVTQGEQMPVSVSGRASATKSISSDHTPDIQSPTPQENNVFDLDDEGPPPQCKTVVLERGPDGLGFSIVGGHGSPHGDLPIYVKNVFSKGAASENGQLKRGDQILSVNGQSLEGLNHEEAVNILKNAKGSVTMSVLS